VDLIRPTRMRLQTARNRIRAVLLSVLCLTLTGGCGASSGGGDGAASCAAVIELDGHTYWGRGGVERIPPTTDRSLPAVLPGCDDSGGQDGAVEEESVEVQVLADLEPTVAVLFQDTIYVRDGAKLPEETQIWFRAPRCASSGEFELTADWLGVRSTKKVRFDGDIRLPYRLMVKVTDGPSSYLGTKLTLRASTSTGPTLSPHDVKASLWEGGRVVATVRCDQGGFDLVDVRALPPV
jgi:hypothetical protein